MLAEIPYMIVWGFFSAMGWMGANWAVEKYSTEKKEPTPVVQEQPKQEKTEEQKTSP
jgi:hypothetical protein